MGAPRDINRGVDRHRVSFRTACITSLGSSAIPPASGYVTATSASAALSFDLMVNPSETNRRTRRLRQTVAPAGRGSANIDCRNPQMGTVVQFIRQA